MLKYILKRLLWMIPVLLGVLLIVFTISNFMPGDPVINILGTDFTQEQYDAKFIELGLDQPFFVRFFNYLEGIVTRFDLGTSYNNGLDVGQQIRSRVWITVRLGLLSTCVTAILGIPVGIISATKQYSVLDYSVTTLSIFFASIPGFWLALMSMLLFSLKLGWLPASGLTTWKHYILPVMCSGLMPIAMVTRMTRTSMLEVIRQDYIRTARAKGLTEGVVIRRHALKNALIPIITVIGGQLGMIVGGNVVIETIFSIPGMGMYLMSAINTRDYPAIMGVVVVLSVFICILNLVVDLVYSLADPRIKAQFAGTNRTKKNKNSQNKAGEGAAA